MRNLTLSTRADQIVVLSQRDLEWRERLRLIREAERFVLTSTYFISCDETGTDFLKELISAAKRGVKVRFLVDAFGQKLANLGMLSHAQKNILQNLFDDLQRAGGEVLFYRPDHWLEKTIGSGNHIKIQMNERGEAIFGSSNISDLSFKSWEEFSVLLRGPIVRELEKIFLDLWSGEKKFSRDPKEAVTSENDLVLLYANPCENSDFLGPFSARGQNAITNAIIEEIDHAQHNIDIATLYFKPQKDLQNALLRAAKRGVSVRIVHSHRNSIPGTELPWIPSYLEYQKLLLSGVEIYEQNPGQHAKIILIDGKRAAFGSYNFEHAADDRLSEAMLLSEDRELVNAIGIFLNSCFNAPGTVKIKSASLNELPLSLKLKSFFCFPATRWI